MLLSGGLDPILVHPLADEPHDFPVGEHLPQPVCCQHDEIAALWGDVRGSDDGLGGNVRGRFQ